MKTNAFDAQVTAALFDATSAVFALGDGSVRFEGGEFSAAHDGAILCAAVHPSGDGVVTGGDDGRVIWHRRGEASMASIHCPFAVASTPASPRRCQITRPSSPPVTTPSPDG